MKKGDLIKMKYPPNELARLYGLIYGDLDKLTKKIGIILNKDVAGYNVYLGGQFLTLGQKELKKI